MKSITSNFKQNKKMIAMNLILLFLFILLDQLTKHLMVEFLIKSEFNSYNILPFFNFTLVLNTGVSFGFFSDFSYGRVIISSVAICIAIIFSYLFLKEGKFIPSLAYSLIITGAVGNTIDRIKYGGVIDFLDFYIKSWHYPAFNVADICIFCGAFILIYYDLFKKKYES